MFLLWLVASVCSSSSEVWPLKDRPSSWSLLFESGSCFRLLINSNLNAFVLPPPASFSAFTPLKYASTFKRSLRWTSCLGSETPSHLRSGNTQLVFTVTASYFTYFKECGGKLGRGHTFAWRRLTASLWCFCPCDSTKHHNVRIDFMLWCFQVLQVFWTCLKARKTELGIDVTIGEKRRCFCFHFALLSCPSRLCFPPLWQSSVWLSLVCQTVYLQSVDSCFFYLMGAFRFLCHWECSIHVCPSCSTLADP